MTRWEKVQSNGKIHPPHWLEIWKGKYKTSYRVDFRKEGHRIRKKIPGDFKRWEEAKRAGEELIYRIRFGGNPKPKSLIASSSLCDEFVGHKRTKSRSTYEGAEILSRKYVKPFLIQHYPYVASWNIATWLYYRHEFRLQYPNRPLFNHWKFFSGLFKLAHQKGLIPKVTLEYNEKRDDRRKKGKLIPNEELQAFLREANRAWRDRIMLQRLTGQRPGVIRHLKKEYVDFDRGVVSIPREVSKNRRTYEFKLPQSAEAILKVRLSNGSPYFFPQETDPEKPMDKHLNGWHSAWERAGIKTRYTPHHVRHTYLTEKVNTPGTNLAVLCYSCDLSLDELMRTYVHFKAEDTLPLAQDSDSRAKEYFGKVVG